MVRVIIVAAVLCLAAVVLAVEKDENGVDKQWCSKTTYCKDGQHCCTPYTCCPNNRHCCGGGVLCCAFDGSDSTPEVISAIEISKK